MEQEIHQLKIALNQARQQLLQAQMQVLQYEMRDLTASENGEGNADS